MSKQRKNAWPEGHTGRLLGRDIPRIDGPVKVTGSAKYPSDQRPARMVFARLVPCPFPTADIPADLSAAFDATGEIPGVLDVVRVCAERTLYLGEPVAAVAAKTPEAAREAAAFLAANLGWTERPGVVNLGQALAENAPKVRSAGNALRERTGESGDAEAAITSALDSGGHVIEARYTTVVQHHACLETHGMVVDFHGTDEATIYGSIQGTFGLLDGPPELLELDEAQIEGNVQHMGGGFGSKFSIGVEGRVACELAKRMNRPVHLFMDRETEFHAAGNRSANEVQVRAGATADGRIVGLVSDSNKLGGVSGGSYAGLPYIYDVAATKSTTRSVHTHTDGNRAMRAPGHPQASFGMESVVDELAYACGIDLVEMRKLNLPEGESGDVWRRQLERAAREIGWFEHPHRTAPGSPAFDLDRSEAIGIGFGLSVWGGGGYKSNQVELSLERSGSLVASVGTQDLGTGSRTLVAAVVAEEFGLDVDDVAARIGSTRLGRGNMSGGSTTTACLAPALKDAAFKLRLELLDVAAAAFGAEADTLDFHPGGSVATKDGRLTLSWSELCSQLGAAGLTTHGTWQADLQASGVHGAQAVKVSVNLLTGRVRVLDMVCCQDAGMILNALAARSQIQGAMVQSLSYALLEERLIDPDLGLRLNPNFESYKLAGAHQIPRMKVLFDDDPRGVIGIGEPPAIPGAAAIAGAVHNACGLRVRDLPLTPDKVLLGLEELRGA